LSLFGAASKRVANPGYFEIVDAFQQTARVVANLADTIDVTEERGKDSRNYIDS
jgi:hypothetical protein